MPGRAETLPFLLMIDQPEISLPFFRDMIQELQKKKEEIGIEENRKRLFTAYQKAGRRSIQSAKVMGQFLQEKG